MYFFVLQENTNNLFLKTGKNVFRIYLKTIYLELHSYYGRRLHRHI